MTSNVFREVERGMSYVELLEALREAAAAPLLLVDCRSKAAFAASRIRGATWLAFSPLLLRRLRRKAPLPSLDDLVLFDAQAFEVRHLPNCRIVIYDELSSAPAPDSTLAILLALFRRDCASVTFLRGGYASMAAGAPAAIADDGAAGHSASSSPPPPTGIPTAADALAEAAAQLQEQPASLIFPHLLLGNQRNAADPDFLSLASVTHVLNLTQDPCPPAAAALPNVCHIPLDDSETQNITQILPEAIAFIDAAKISGGRVLVYCAAGVSRSAAVTMAYLVRECGISLQQAYGVVKAKRTCVSPNLGFMGQLLGFERLCAASAARPRAAAAPHPTEHSPQILA